MRELRLFLYFIVGLLLSAIAVLSYAGDPTTAGPPGVQYIPATYGYTSGQTVLSGSLGTVCSGLQDLANKNNPPGATTITYTPAPDHVACLTSTGVYAAVSMGCGGVTGYAVDSNNLALGRCRSSLANTCPPGATNVNGTCTCGTGLVYYDGQCKTPVCNTTNSSTSQYYDIGTSDSGSPGAVRCMNGCVATFDGTSPAATGIVNGVRHYYASGKYTATGQGSVDRCTAGTGSGSSNMQSTSSGQNAPTNTCPAGSATVTQNGQTSCFSTSTGQNTTTDTPQSTTKTTTSGTTTNADNSKTVTTTTTNQTTGGTTTVTSTYGAGCSDPSTCQAVSVTTSTTGGGANGEASTGNNKDNNGDTFCQDNPNSIACQDIEPGTAADPSSLYSKAENGPTFDSSLAKFQSTIQSAGFYQAATSFFTVNVPSGACSGLSTSFDFNGTQFQVDLTPVFCSSTADEVYSLMAIGLAIGAMYVAFRWAFY